VQGRPFLYGRALYRGCAGDFLPPPHQPELVRRFLG
jgi:hypothetical protein